MSTVNLKEKMSRTFADFWNINLGHVVVAVGFLCGLAVTWQKTVARIEEVATSEGTHYSITRSALDSAVVERNLKIAALEQRMDNADVATSTTEDLKLNALAARVQRTEDDVRVVADLKTQVTVIATNLTYLNKQIDGWRQDMKEQALARIAPR